MLVGNGHITAREEEKAAVTDCCYLAGLWHAVKNHVETVFMIAQTLFPSPNETD